MKQNTAESISWLTSVERLLRSQSFSPPVLLFHQENAQTSWSWLTRYAARLARASLGMNPQMVSIAPWTSRAHGSGATENTSASWPATVKNIMETKPIITPLLAVIGP